MEVKPQSQCRNHTDINVLYNHSMLRSRACIVALALAVALLAGCGDDSPTGPGSKQTRIVYAHLGAVRGLYIMRADGSHREPLLVDAFINVTPSWSPDGSHVIFVRRYIDASFNYHSGIYRIDANGTNLACIDSTHGYCMDPRYSRDGSKIVFSTPDAGQFQNVWVMNTDGSGAARITPLSEPSGGADWSPDGTRLVYQRGVPGVGYRIYTMKTDGTDTLNLGTGVYPGSNQFSPRWSPDGTAIVYIDDRGAPPIPLGGNYAWIHVVNADGTNPHPITPPDDGIWLDPSWAPDSRQIAVRYENPDAEIFTMNRDGSNVVNVTQDTSSDDITPDWGPAGP